MNLSYWEIKSWLSHVDFCVIGSGIVGLNCALHLKRQFPKAKILILEKGVLPQGASTKNAGFACFGSLGEILEDLRFHSEDEVVDLVKKRVNGLALLRETIGDKVLNFQKLGGYELFLEDNPRLFEAVVSKRDSVNKLLKPFFEDEIFSIRDTSSNFKNVMGQCVFNPFEGQLDPGRMMESLVYLVQSMDIKILNGISVRAYSEGNDSVHIKTDQFEFPVSKLMIATNGFANQLIREDVRPARAQVLITTPIVGLQIKGTFHMDKGYYYFRNIDNRILLGGGRHLDFKGEETTTFNQTKNIQNALEALLETTILPGHSFEIEQRWSGIMGLGNQKKALVKQLSNNVYCGVRLGGMGVAIGSMIGKELAELV